MIVAVNMNQQAAVSYALRLNELTSCASPA